MTDRDLFKQALEALEESHPEPYRHLIAALRERLAREDKWPMVEIEPVLTVQPERQELAEREWVGLTEEELDEAMGYWSADERSAYGGAWRASGEYVDVKDTWRYIEAKLKEKNA